MPARLATDQGRETMTEQRRVKRGPGDFPCPVGLSSPAASLTWCDEACFAEACSSPEPTCSWAIVFRDYLKMQKCARLLRMGLRWWSTGLGDKENVDRFVATIRSALKEAGL